MGVPGAPSFRRLLTATGAAPGRFLVGLRVAARVSPALAPPQACRRNGLPGLRVDRSRRLGSPARTVGGLRLPAPLAAGPALGRGTRASGRRPCGVPLPRLPIALRHAAVSLPCHAVGPELPHCAGLGQSARAFRLQQLVPVVCGPDQPRSVRGARLPSRQWSHSVGGLAAVGVRLCATAS